MSTDLCVHYPEKVLRPKNESGSMDTIYYFLDSKSNFISNCIVV